MATVTIAITSTTYTKARSAKVEAGVDYLNITVHEVSSGNKYGLQNNTPTISGCSYTKYTPSGGAKSVYSLSGYPSSGAVGTYSLIMAKVTSTLKTAGADISLTIGYYYYSRLIYNANTGSGEPATQELKDIYTSQPSAYTHTISSDTPTLSGYIFKGWSTTQYTPGTGTASYQPGATISVSYSTSATSGTTLYAVWEKLATDNINVKVNGVWKSGKAFVKVNGTWKESDSVWTKVNGVWKKNS